MLYYAITVQKEIITGKHESAVPISADTFKSTAFEGQQVITVPADTIIQDGHNIGEYTADWELKPMAQRVAEGYVVREGCVSHDDEDMYPVTAEGIVQMQISNLIKELADTDYKIIKCYEYFLMGLPLPYEIEQLHAKRQAARDKINMKEGKSNDEIYG